MNVSSVRFDNNSKKIKFTTIVLLFFSETFWENRTKFQEEYQFFYCTNIKWLEKARWMVCKGNLNQFITFLQYMRQHDVFSKNSTVLIITFNAVKIDLLLRCMTLRGAFDWFFVFISKDNLQKIFLIMYELSYYTTTRMPQ